ncbi:MAG: helicase-related protein [Pirellulales bacterium]
MNNLIHIATAELARFLDAKLPELGADWWLKHVVNRLSFQQQRIVQERGHNTVKQLDFAALLRVFDQNWYELSSALILPREGRTWVKELQTVRNKWAHMSAEVMPASEVYRDADTLGRFLMMIGATQASLDTVDASKAAAVAAMANTRGDSHAKATEPSPRNGFEQPAHPGVEVSPNSISLFRVGDLVALRSNPATILPVIEVVSGGGEYRYRVFQNNAKATYYESQLQSPATAADERRTLTARELQAYLTTLQILSASTANLFSLRSGRVQFVPYQYRPVLKLIRSDRPRLLIADEVGVGKTIEAGLIIKELRARLDLSTVLIICPKALVAERKWFVEMKRFDEHFTALDGPLLRHCLQETHLEGEWPAQYAKAIIPFSLFDSDLVLGRSRQGKSKDQGLLNLDPPPKFDLVIVDEAHHIRNSETFLHQGVRYFCDNAEAVLFLSATPVQLGSEDLYTLLNVLRPDLIIDHASFAQMAAPNRHINSAIQHCRAAGEKWQQEARASLDEVAQTEWGRLFLRESSAFQGIYDRLEEQSLSDADRLGLTRALEGLYTFSPLINRTRRRDIGEFTTRKPETVPVEFTSAQKELHDGLLAVIARILAVCHGQQNVKFMMTTIRRQSASCLYGLAPLLKDILTGKLNRLELMEASDNDDDTDLGFVEQVRADVAALLEQARDLDPHDPKVEEFVRVLMAKSKMRNNKALVFSTFRHTLAYLAQHMQRTTLRYGLIHGNVPDEERADLRRRFRLPKEEGDSLDVLLSSEVGCEGLDFEFCDFLINYDLPWNPMRIEQRIGRIDRYGQRSEAVAIVNFVTPGTVDADIYERCLLRIGVFQHAIGGNEEILGEITRELHDIAENFTLTPDEREARLRQLADNGIRRIQEEQELESKQADLFGLNVPNQSWQQEIEAAESYWLSAPAIQGCVSAYLAARLDTEADHLLGEKALKTLRLSQEARAELLKDFKSLPRSAEPIAREWEKWLKGAQPTLAVTFDQGAAAENPTATHLSVTHPLVRQAARFLQLDDPAYVALVVRSTEVPPGDYRFALYRWKKLGVKLDELLVPVASDAAIEKVLLVLLQSAAEVEHAVPPSSVEFDALDAQHHIKWTAAQANYIAENRQQVEHRIQSLTVSQAARCKAIEDQIGRATNEKIRLMKQSELTRANADFTRRMEELQQAAGSGDIHAAAVLFGTITVNREGQK